MFKTVGHADGVVVDVTHTTKAVALRTVGEGNALFELVIVVVGKTGEVFAIATFDVGAVETGIHRNHECHNNTRHSGMDA